MSRRLLLAAAAAVLFTGPTMAATWTVDPAKSKIGFSGVQTDQPFFGSFKTWTAAVEFDPAQPAAAHVLITIDTGSATTGDTQRDEALPGSDWFDVSGFPKATFEAQGFMPKGGNAYETKGTLSIRGVSKDVVLPFTLTIDGDTAHAVGSAKLLRNAFGVGQGAWASDQYVAFDVGVDVDLVAKKAP
jgi:polyisoprenoid-binding protein YceI